MAEKRSGKISYASFGKQIWIARANETSLNVFKAGYEALKMNYVYDDSMLYLDFKGEQIAIPADNCAQLTFFNEKAEELYKAKGQERVVKLEERTLPENAEVFVGTDENGQPRKGGVVLRG